jgi:hypothetical protein
MKNFRVLFTLVLFGASLQAQNTAPPVYTADAAPPAVDPSLAPQRTPQELEQLLAPIALYPDALIAIILPASTVPTDVVLAARHLRENPGDRAQIEHRAWDESVKSLTSYPEVLMWMDENLNWTRQVGEAFATQPADVMQAVQRLRAKARAAGTLVDTPQQQVIAEPQVIRIVPAQPDIIYVPHYEPEIVFVDQPVYYSRPYLTFGFGVPVGSWLAFECDWRHNSIWVGNRHRRWTGHDWHRPLIPIAPIGPGFSYTRTPEVRQWRPPPQPLRNPSFTLIRPYRSEIARPTPFSVTASRFYSQQGRMGYADRRYDSAAPSITNPSPRNVTPAPRPGYQGQRFSSPTVVVPNPATSAQQVAPPAPTLQPLPQARRSGRDATYSTDQASRNFRNNQTNAAAQISAGVPAPAVVVPANPPVTTAPTLQPLPSARRNSNDASQPHESRGRNFRGGQANPISAAPVMPAAPAPAPIQPPTTNSFPQRSYSRGVVTPPVSSPVISVPAGNRVAPAPVVEPAAPAVTPAAPPAQPAPARTTGESRGYRGASGRPGEARAP